MLGRYRNLIILVGVLFLQVLGLAVQVKREGHDQQDTRLIRVWAVGAITPFERGLVWIQTSTGNLWHNYFYLRGVRAENRGLKEQIEQMRVEQVRLREDATQARRLQTLLAFKEQFISRTVPAQVIGTSGSDFSRVIYIDKGENAGLKRDMAVITADGVVGKILLVYRNTSQVLLISDQSSGVGALLEKSRIGGVIRGTATGEVVLDHVMSDEQVPVGETVLTSGGDQIFPKGLPVGTVTRVGNPKELFLTINIKPAANLSKLEEVLVIVEKQERQATAEDNVRVRAADILAQRLPSVPDKPAANANAATPGAATAGASSTATKTQAAPVKPEGTSPAGAASKPESSTSPKPGSVPTTSGSTIPATSSKPDSLATKPATVPPKPKTPVQSNPPKNTGETTPQ
jgi:rod shape-determining protein MreC